MRAPKKQMRDNAENRRVKVIVNLSTSEEGRNRSHKQTKREREGALLGYNKEVAMDAHYLPRLSQPT